MVDLGRPARTLGGRGLTLLVAAGLAGCAVVPGSRLDESQRLVQSLRNENARLKDQVLGLQAQNRDYADRAVDDLRRLTVRDQAIERLERSVQGYQDDRDRLAAAYRRLAVGLGQPSGEIPAGMTVEPGQASSPGRRTVPSAGDRDRGRSERLSAADDEDADPVPPGGSGP
jgi:hypothetical protein